MVMPKVSTPVKATVWSIDDDQIAVTHRLGVREGGWFAELLTSQARGRWEYDSLREFEEDDSAFPWPIRQALVAAARSEKRCGHHPEVVLRPPTAAYIDEEYEHIHLACPGCFPNLFAPDPIDYRQVAADLRIQIAAIEVELRAARRVSDN